MLRAGNRSPWLEGFKGYYAGGQGTSEYPSRVFLATQAIPSGNPVGDSGSGPEGKLPQSGRSRWRSLTVSGTGRLSPGPGGAQPEIVAGSTRVPAYPHQPQPRKTRGREDGRAEAKDQADSRAGGGVGLLEGGAGRFVVPNSLEKAYESWARVARVCVRSGGSRGATSSSRRGAIVPRRSLIGCQAGGARPKPLLRVTQSAPT